MSASPRPRAFFGDSVRPDFRSRRGGGVALPGAPGPEGGPVAQVGAPRVLRKRVGERLPDALRVAGRQPARGGGGKVLHGRIRCALICSLWTRDRREGCRSASSDMVACDLEEESGDQQQQSAA